MVRFSCIAYVFFLALVAILALPAHGLEGNFYLPPSPVTILTAWKTGEIPANKPPETRLRVQALQKAPGISRVIFSPANAEQPLGYLEFRSSASDVVWEGTGSSGKKLTGDHLCIILGAPLPMDVLPVKHFFSGGKAREYEMRSRAGGRTFVDRVRVTARAVSGRQAGRSGWLRIKGAHVSVELRMIEAVDQQSGQLLVRQLWAAGSSWWLYEETPYRRSWRLQ